MKARVVSDVRGRKQVIDGCESPCAIERGMRILGGKWTGSILWHLQDGPVRFNNLARMVSGASKKMITDRLRELESRDLVTRTVVEQRPIAVTYELTPLGQSALSCLNSLRIWSEGFEEYSADA